MRHKNRKRLHRAPRLSPIWLILASGLGVVAGIALSLALGLSW